MTDQEFLDHLQAAERYIDQNPGPRGMRGACEHLDRRLRGRCQDRTQRDALRRICCSLHDGSARILDDTIEALQAHLRRIDSPRQHEKMIRFAENYGADSATIHRIKQEHTAAMMATMTAGPFANIAADACKKLATLLNETTMNKTPTELQAELDAALKAEAVAAEAKAKADDLQYHVDLATATTVLLGSIQSPKSPVRGDLLARFRKELAPLARHFGAKIVLVGDRTSALLVQA